MLSSICPLEFQNVSSTSQKLHELEKLEQIFKNFKISKRFNASIDFAQIQYQRSLIDIFYFGAVLGGKLEFYKSYS